MALLGCNVITTDQIEVLPLLKRNVEWNTSRISQMNPGSDLLGSIQAVELDWGNEDHIKAVAPPFDYIIGTDVLGYEIRSTSVHEEMLQMWKSNFNVKLVPKAKMDSKYQHPSIQLFVMGVDSSVGNTERAAERIDQQNEDGTKETKLEKDENDDNSNPAGKVGDFSGQIMDEDSLLATRLPNGKLSEWETRRYGSMAARLLRDVKIT
ncbi:S-adenosyl-L-methionine-dependent methyltransferases superfamily protein [Citrus sinensis]|uniref:S-adenosyl-L-methionine-dependent methyltransferases superfamily protein n=2 Tax=Citrus TaxID=2706 RepID=A0ACB8ITG2_CITSI|nr:S-adenosyl-L-methionine-dependent methyltransferases superfamily protein [Citrus sinensis]